MSYTMSNGEQFSLGEPGSQPSMPGSTQRPLRFAAIGLDHGHAFGMINGLLSTGCELVGTATSDDSAEVARHVRAMMPDVPVRPPADLLADPDIDLIVTAAVPVQRGPIAVAAMESGKDVVADKPGCSTLEQLGDIRETAARTGRKWWVVFSERLDVRAARRATDLVREGRIGQVVQTVGFGPHREGTGRPEWFYDEQQYGGILTDIASHQFDQFLWYTGAHTAEVVASGVGNYAHPDLPGMSDFGDVVLRADNGANGYIRVDWFTPEGLPTWGDGRLFILGTQGYIELRKYVDLAGRSGGDHLFLVDQQGVHYEDCSDVKLDFYPMLVADVRHRTDLACPQEHTFEAMRLALVAQQRARRLGFLDGKPESPR
jgi:predicted dehydrogenase